MSMKQRGDNSSSVQRACLLSTNIFSSKEKRGLSPSPGPKSAKFIYQNDSFQIA
jgi:hypothetical protein